MNEPKIYKTIWIGATVGLLASVSYILTCMLMGADINSTTAAIISSVLALAVLSRGRFTQGKLKKAVPPIKC